MVNHMRSYAQCGDEVAFKSKSGVVVLLMGPLRIYGGCGKLPAERHKKSVSEFHGMVKMFLGGSFTISERRNSILLKS